MDLCGNVPRGSVRGPASLLYAKSRINMSASEHLPFVYGGLEPEQSDFERSRVLIWPVGYEKTVSYGRGTGGGPDAIIEASRNMELYDEEIGSETCAIGIHTLPDAEVEHEPAEMMQLLEREALRLIDTGKFVCMLGGEHSITGPVVRSFSAKYPKLSVLQIDAHADLRESYDGTPHSHASAMRRVVECCPAVQVGIRSLSKEEARAIPELPTRVFFAKDIVGKTGWVEEVVAALTEEVYLTIDIDGLDPSLVAATGTPEPGGLGWYEVLELLRAVAAKRKIVGMDCVEVSSSSTDNVSAFVASKLVYKTLGYVFREEALAAG